MAVPDYERHDTAYEQASDTTDNGASWSECQCEACNSEEVNDGANGYENHQGDGPSGYDYFSDTRRWC